MKISILIFLCHIAFPAFENTLKFQHLGKNIQTLSFRCSAEMSMGEKNILKSEMGLQLNIVF